MPNIANGLGNSEAHSADECLALDVILEHRQIRAWLRSPCSLQYRLQIKSIWSNIESGHFASQHENGGQLK